MSDGIEPFYRVAPPESGRQRPVGILRPVPLHFTLAGAGLFLGAAGLLAYEYFLQLYRVEVEGLLRLQQPGKIYQASTQIKLLLVVLLGAASLIQFRAAAQFRSGQRRTWPVGLSVALLLGGIPAGVLLWTLVIDLPGLPATAVLAVQRAGAALLVAQALGAAAYGIVLLGSAGRRASGAPIPARLSWLGRAVWWGMGLSLVLAVGLGVALAVLTDLIELPLRRPEPGELLYATSFDGFVEEWDIYKGRDSAQFAAWDTLAPVSATPGGPADQALAGGVLVISYDSPKTNEVIFSTPDRKFNDIDLRVTARQVAGPDDNQYGVIFRYRSREDYYGFFISSDGYYSLVKRKDGRLVDVSTWGESGAIRQGGAANELRILALGDEFRFFINGQPVPLCLRGEYKTSMWTGRGECFTDEETYLYRDADFKQGQIGLAAGTSVDLSSAVVIAFDDLVIMGPDPQAMRVLPGE